jgi:hypothetical protein
MISNQYYLISQQQSPRLAIVEGYLPEDLLLAFSSFQTYSIKARLWRKFLQIAFSSGIPLMVSRKVPAGRIPLLPEAVLEKIDSLFDNCAEYPIFQFPHDPGRNRFSAFIKQGTKSYYMKCIFDQGNQKTINNEIEVFERLSACKFEKFKIPPLIDSIVSDNFAAAFYEPIPIDTSHPKKWGQPFFEVWKELTDKTCWEIPISELKWFQDLYSIPQWHSLLQGISTKALIVYQSHGDFLPWNLRYDKDSFYLFDWEDARKDAPFLYDPLHYFTFYETLVRQKRPFQIASTLDKFLESCNYSGVNLTDYVLIGLGFQFINSKKLMKKVSLEIATAYKFLK